jgi:hypothetical protein
VLLSVGLKTSERAYTVCEPLRRDALHGLQSSAVQIRQEQTMILASPRIMPALASSIYA